jgi:hypothetical protein
MQGQGEPHDYQGPGETIAAAAREGFKATDEPAESQSFLNSWALNEGSLLGIPCRIRWSGSQD